MNLRRWNPRKWNYDPVTGEWKRVVYRSGDRVLVDARSQYERRTGELVHKRERRHWIVIGVGAILFLTGLSWAVEDTSWERPYNGFFYYILMFVAAMLVLPGLGMELLYQLGVQWIKGAKVLDPEPVRPGKKEVEEQKAHGDARLATETEAKSAASGGGRRSSVHDQEF